MTSGHPRAKQQGGYVILASKIIMLNTLEKRTFQNLVEAKGRGKGSLKRWGAPIHASQRSKSNPDLC
jgi:hypothetical protein